MSVPHWHEAGSPAIDNERVRKAATLIHDVLAVEPVGGSLAIVFDEWNVADSDLDVADRFLTSQERLPGDAGERDASDAGWKESLTIQRSCLTALRFLSNDERLSALAMAEGLWFPDTPLDAKS